MKDIMTPKEWRKNNHLQDTLSSIIPISTNEADAWMQSYAKYYAKALIESLTDEEIENAIKRKGMKRFSDSIELQIDDKLEFKRQGAKWARNELLKRIEL